MSYDIEIRKRSKLWQEQINNFAALNNATIAYNNQSQQIALTNPIQSTMKQLKVISSDWLTLSEIGPKATDGTILGHQAQFTVTISIPLSIVAFIKTDILYKIKDNPNIFDNTKIDLVKFSQIQDIGTASTKAVMTWNVAFVNTLQETPVPPEVKGAYIDPVTGDYRDVRTNELADSSKTIIYDPWKDYQIQVIIALRNPNYYTSS